MPTRSSGRGAGTRGLIATALAALAAVVLSGLAAPAPAQGAVSPPTAAGVAQAGTTGTAVTVNTRDKSGYRTRCFDTRVVVTPQYDASETGTWDGRWSAEAEIVAHSELYNYDSYEGTSASKAFDFRVCDDYGYGLKGTYQVNVYWRQYDAEGSVIAEGVTHGSFEYILKPRALSRLTVRKFPYGSTGWTFVGRLTRAGKPYARQRVQVWIRWNGSWVNFEETKRTGARGRVSWHTRGDLQPNPYVFQLRYPGNVSTRPARSDNFRLSGR